MPNTNPLKQYTQSVGDEMIERLASIKFKPSKILDLGAGHCQHSEILKKRFKRARVISLDVALPRLQSAKPKGIFNKNFTRLCADMTQLPMSNNAVDMIFCNMALHQVDLKSALAEMARVLQPDGLLMLSLPGPDTLIELRTTMRAIDDCAHVHVFPDMHDLGDQLLKLGFKDPVMDVERVKLNFNSIDHLFESLTECGERNCHAERTKHLIGKNRWQEMKAHYPADNRASIETSFAHAWGGERIQHTDDTGVTFVSLDSLKNHRPGS